MAPKSKIIFNLLLLFILSSCANQLPPGGGELDKVPPRIIESIPANGTTNYTDDYFEITFSEYVDRRSVQDAIFISPPIAKGLDYDWGGKTLSVYFKDTLRSNTTYTIVIGTDVIDLNNRNKMAEPFSFAFSTGNQIDIGKISGKIFDKDPGGTSVFAYRQNENEPDPAVTKPEYVSQVGKNGKFTLLGLGNGDYKLFAIRDNFRDLKYQKNDDQFGVQFKDVIISDDKKEFTDVDFFLSIEDTIPPTLSNVMMKDRNHLQIEFNEPIDSSKLSADNFYIFDSTANARKEITYFFKGSINAKQFLLSISDSLVEDNNNYLVCMNFIDMNGVAKEYDASQFSVKTQPDTLIPKVLKVEGTLPEGKVDHDNPLINVEFDDGFDVTKIDTAISITDAKGFNYGCSINLIDDASFNIIVNSKLKQKTEYQLKINLGAVQDAAGNFADSVYQTEFTTASELDFSGVSGTVLAETDSVGTMIVLSSASRGEREYKVKPVPNSKFNFSKIVPGKYLLWGFADQNGNNSYDIGKIIPYKKSEKFVFHPDTLNLRARWPVGDIILDFTK